MIVAMFRADAWTLTWKSPDRAGATESSAVELARPSPFTSNGS